MDALKNSTGINTLDMAMEDRVVAQPGHGPARVGPESKMEAVQGEMKRMARLPQTSSYATHRLRVLNKILQLMSIQRSISQDEELELLFAGLSI